jgi:hypothetical protein
VTTLIARVRALCLGLPEAFEVEAWEHPTFRVGGGRGKMFCIAAADGSSIRLKADPEEREALLAQGEPFYVPPYVGAKGWAASGSITRRSTGRRWPNSLPPATAWSHRSAYPRRSLGPRG